MATGTPPVGSLPRGFALGIALLVATKAADLVTTLVAVTYVPSLSESNAAVVTVVEAVGLVPGLVGLGLVLVVAVTVVTECSVAMASSDGPSLTPGLIRFLGYVPLSVWNVAVAAYNLGLLALAVRV